MDKGRRSSILKLDKSRNVDNDGAQSSPKEKRRVSFAASNFIKPFVADPDKNTIWDTTYEEIVDHADSSHEQSKYDAVEKLNKSLNVSASFPTALKPALRRNREKEIKPKSIKPSNSIIDKENIITYAIPNEEVTSVDMELTLIDDDDNSPLIDKENIPIPKLFDTSEMEFTCQITSKNGPFLPPPQFIKLDDDSETSKMNMSLTCQFPLPPQNIVHISPSNKENVFIPKIFDEDNSPEIFDQTEMEFTCQVPAKLLAKNNVSISMKENIVMPPRGDETSMEFTCQIPNNLLNQMNESDVKENEEKPDMEMTCNNPEKSLIPPPIFDDSSSKEMELSCELPNCQNDLIKSNLNQTDLDITKNRIIPKINESTKLHLSSVPNDTQVEFENNDDMEVTLPKEIQSSLQLSLPKMIETSVTTTKIIDKSSIVMEDKTEQQKMIEPEFLLPEPIKQNEKIIEGKNLDISSSQLKHKSSLGKNKSDLNMSSKTLVNISGIHLTSLERNELKNRQFKLLSCYTPTLDRTKNSTRIPDVSSNNISLSDDNSPIPRKQMKFNIVEDNDCDITNLLTTSTPKEEEIFIEQSEDVRESSVVPMEISYCDNTASKNSILNESNTPPIPQEENPIPQITLENIKIPVFEDSPQQEHQEVDKTLDENQIKDLNLNQTKNLSISMELEQNPESSRKETQNNKTYTISLNNTNTLDKMLEKNNILYSEKLVPSNSIDLKTPNATFRANFMTSPCTDLTQDLIDATLTKKIQECTQQSLLEIKSFGDTQTLSNIKIFGIDELTLPNIDNIAQKESIIEEIRAQPISKDSVMDATLAKKIEEYKQQNVTELKNLSVTQTISNKTFNILEKTSPKESINRNLIDPILTTEIQGSRQPSLPEIKNLGDTQTLTNIRTFDMEELTLPNIDDLIKKESTIKPNFRDDSIDGALTAKNPEYAVQNLTEIKNLGDTQTLSNITTPRIEDVIVPKTNTFTKKESPIGQIKAQPFPRDDLLVGANLTKNNQESAQTSLTADVKNCGDTQTLSNIKTFDIKELTLPNINNITKEESIIEKSRAVPFFSKVDINNIDCTLENSKQSCDYIADTSNIILAPELDTTLDTSEDLKKAHEAVLKSENTFFATLKNLTRSHLKFDEPQYNLNVVSEKLGQIVKRTTHYLENFDVKPLNIPDMTSVLEALEDIDYENSVDNLETTSGNGTFDDSLLQSSNSIECLEEKIRKLEKGQDYWKFESVKNDKYKFSCLNSTLKFIIVVKSNTDEVQSINVENNCSSESSTIFKYVHKMLMEQLNPHCINQAMGNSAYDLLSVLTYIELVFNNKIISFFREFRRLSRNYGMKIDEDFRITFKIHHVKLRVLLEITINCQNIENLSSDDIVINQIIGKLKVEELIDLSKKCSRDHTFLPSFVNGIEEYLRKKESKH